MFMKRALTEQPDDVLSMASEYFTDPQLKASVEGKTTQTGVRQAKFIQQAYAVTQREKDAINARVLKQKQQRANTKARGGRRKISRRQSLDMFRAMDKTKDGNLNYLEIKRNLKT